MVRYAKCRVRFTNVYLLCVSEKRVEAVIPSIVTISTINKHDAVVK
jgi:hypothetical protein